MAAEKNQKYQLGERFKCPHCNEDSYVRLKKELADWTVTEVLVCAFCNKVLQEETEPAGSGVDCECKQSEQASDRLQAFWGESEKSPKPRLDVGTAEKQFCRDCRHYLFHPFLSRCNLHKRPVEPMHDCANFEARPLDDDEKADADSSAEN